MAGLIDGLWQTTFSIIACASARAPAAAEPLDGAVRHAVDWISATKDAGRLPFAIIDKTGARVFVFASGGMLLGSSPVQLGIARPDDRVPGIGTRPLALWPADRTTPAGRFEAAPGVDAAGHEILWFDYAAAVSMDGAVPAAGTRRLPQHLATPTTDDNPISYGCIDMPPGFFVDVVQRNFADGGIVYILPATRAPGLSSAPPLPARTAHAGYAPRVRCGVAASR